MARAGFLALLDVNYSRHTEEPLAVRIFGGLETEVPESCHTTGKCFTAVRVLMTSTARHSRSGYEGSHQSTALRF